MSTSHPTPFVDEIIAQPPSPPNRRKYNTGGSNKLYVPSFFSEEECVVGIQNYDPYDQRPLLFPDEVVISTKNLTFEVYNGENHLLSSTKYTLRVCTVNCGLSNMWVKLELVCGMTNTPVYCVKNDRKGKRAIKGRCCQELDISKHGYTKAKMEFRFRETSSDNIVDKFRLNVNIYNESTLLLTFRSPRFRTVVRSPHRGKKKINKEKQTKDISNQQSKEGAENTSSKKRKLPNQQSFHP